MLAHDGGELVARYIAGVAQRGRGRPGTERDARGASADAAYVSG
jgi:hypothetical protein